MTSTLIRPAGTTQTRPGDIDVPSRASILDAGFGGVQFLLCPPNSSPWLWAAYRAVSYTHLTLPTIYSV